MTTKKRDIALSELQAAVMRVLWQRGEVSTAEVADVLAGERGIKHTTVATLLTRLEKRGAVALRRDGRQLIYRALVSESEVRRSMVSDLIASLFAGDHKALMAHLMQEDDTAPGDLDRLRRKLGKGKSHD